MALEQSEAERKAMQLAESSRESHWRKPSFLRDLWSNDDVLAYRIGQRTLEGRFHFLEDWGIGLGLSADDLRPMRVRRPEASTVRATAA